MSNVVTRMIRAKRGAQLWDPTKELAPSGSVDSGQELDMVGAAEEAGYIIVRVGEAQHKAFAAHFELVKKPAEPVAQ